MSRIRFKLFKPRSGSQIANKYVTGLTLVGVLATSAFLTKKAEGTPHWVGTVRQHIHWNGPYTSQFFKESEIPAYSGWYKNWLREEADMHPQTIEIAKGDNDKQIEKLENRYQEDLKKLKSAIRSGNFLNTASDAYSFVTRRQITSNYDGAFVWADRQGTDFAPTAANEFWISSEHETKTRWFLYGAIAVLLLVLVLGR